MASHAEIMAYLKRNADYGDAHGSASGAGYIGGAYIGGSPMGGAYIGGMCLNCARGGCMNCGGAIGGFLGEQKLRREYAAMYPLSRGKGSKAKNMLAHQERNTKFEEYLAANPVLAAEYAKELEDRKMAAHLFKQQYEALKNANAGLTRKQLLALYRGKHPKQRKARAPKGRAGCKSDYCFWRSDYIANYKQNNNGMGPSRADVKKAWAAHKAGQENLQYLF